VKNAGNFNWTDDSGDGIKEPLLDVSNSTLFNPVLVPGSGGGGGGNTAPSVSITSPATNDSFIEGTSITFTGSASDPEDGDLTSSLAWISSLDGSIGTGGTFSTSSLSQGHTITASATDSGGLTGSASVTITVTASGGGSGISLSATAYKVKGEKYADLAWSGTTSTSVDVYRNGSKVATTTGSTYTDGSLGKGGGSATYKVCEAGKSTCSNEVTVTW
jgi:hypothetical protein